MCSPLLRLLLFQSFFTLLWGWDGSAFGVGAAAAVTATCSYFIFFLTDKKITTRRETKKDEKINVLRSLLPSFVLSLSFIRTLFLMQKRKKGNTISNEFFPFLRIVSIFGNPPSMLIPPPINLNFSLAITNNLPITIYQVNFGKGTYLFEKCHSPGFQRENFTSFQYSEIPPNRNQNNLSFLPPLKL